MRSDNMLVSFEEIEKEYRWQALLKALETEYTISMRDVCRMLKCTRPWVNEYVRPFVHYVYISNGYSKKTAPFTKLASLALGRDVKDSIWFNKEEFLNFIHTGFKRCTRQTIRIGLDQIIQEDKLADFRRDYLYYAEQMRKASLNNVKLCNEYRKQRDCLIENSLSSVGQEVFLNLPDKYRRSECPAVEVVIPDFSLDDLIAVHDILDYGDTSEMVYRELFSQGYCKLELELEGKSEKRSKKVYYLKPVNYGSSDYVDYVTVRYCDYVRLIRV